MSLIVLVVIAVVVESHASSDVGAQRLGRVIFSFTNLLSFQSLMSIATTDETSPAVTAFVFRRVTTPQKDRRPKA